MEDLYIQFIKDNIEYIYKDNDKKEIDNDILISVHELYVKFKLWYIEKFSKGNVGLFEFSDDISMSGRLGPQSKRGFWSGIRIKS